MNAPRSTPRLNVGQALREGCQAFSRAPWHFVGFALLLAALQLLLQALQPTFSAEKLVLPSGVDPWINWQAWLPTLRYLTVSLGLMVFTALLGVVLNLWGSCGLVRAAWIALGGKRPGFSTFLRWDPRALLRLYLPGVLLGFGVIAVVAVVVLLAVVLSQVNAWLTLPPGLALLAATLYLGVSQAFLPQVALLHDDHPFDALAQGPRVVDPVWGRVVELLTLQFLLLLAGLLACGVGLLVTIPLMSCVSTAAYRQLFGPDDRTGLTRGLPEVRS
ncbi:MAG: hypothetical protein VKO39_01305 [Cyanobacteriota bacterium]|nr:hypothetical protein [Cyanobacteriota bacterium]